MEKIAAQPKAACITKTNNAAVHPHQQTPIATAHRSPTAGADKAVAEALGLDFAALSGPFTTFKAAVLGKLHGDQLSTAIKLRKRHLNWVIIKIRAAGMPFAFSITC